MLCSTPALIQEMETMNRISLCYCVHDDSYFLAESIASFRAAGEIFVFVSRLP